ncbi:hypothetical protein Plhal304r1_c004g0017871 [Plasmopara halstedii]
MVKPSRLQFILKLARGGDSLPSFWQQFAADYITKDFRCSNMALYLAVCGNSANCDFSDEDAVKIYKTPTIMSSRQITPVEYIQKVYTSTR